MIFSKKYDVNILTVEDDKVLADNLVDYLSSLGYLATPAYGGREGLRRFEKGISDWSSRILRCQRWMESNFWMR